MNVRSNSVPDTGTKLTSTLTSDVRTTVQPLTLEFETPSDKDARPSPRTPPLAPLGRKWPH